MLNTGSVARALRAWPLVAVATAGLVLTACSSSSSSSAPSPASSPTGTASVAYAASLEFLNEKVFGPAFQSAKGFSYSGRAGESGDLESAIAAKQITPNVFQAVGGDNVTPLFPKFTKWYVQYAGTQIAVAYSPTSKYAADFAAIASGKKPICDLFPIMEKKGFLLGRTDPNTDPQGRSFIYMIELATTYCHLPSDTVTKILGAPVDSPTSPQIFAESSLDCDAAVRPARRVQRVPHPGDRSCTCPTSRCRPHDQPRRLRRQPRSTPRRIDHDHRQRDQAPARRWPSTSRSSASRPARGTAFVEYALSAAGLALYKPGGTRCSPRRSPVTPAWFPPR